MDFSTSCAIPKSFKETFFKGIYTAKALKNMSSLSSSSLSSYDGIRLKEHRVMIRNLTDSFIKVYFLNKYGHIDEKTIKRHIIKDKDYFDYCEFITFYYKY